MVTYPLWASIMPSILTEIVTTPDLAAGRDPPGYRHPHIVSLCAFLARRGGIIQSTSAHSVYVSSEPPFISTQ